MDSKKFWMVVAGVATSAAAIERFYKHPTLGTGLQAFVAAVAVGRLF